MTELRDDLAALCGPCTVPLAVTTDDGITHMYTYYELRTDGLRSLLVREPADELTVHDEYRTIVAAERLRDQVTCLWCLRGEVSP